MSKTRATGDNSKEQEGWATRIGDPGFLSTDGHAANNSASNAFTPSAFLPPNIGIEYAS